MRLFIAIEIDDAVRANLAEFQRELRATGAQVRWVRPEAMHLTLAFLGEVDIACHQAALSSISVLQPRGRNSPSPSLTTPISDPQTGHQ